MTGVQRAAAGEPVVHQVVNPATEQVVAAVELLDERATDAAIERAARAFPAWRGVSGADRARLLRRFADLVDAHVEELAALEVSNSGHTISNARWEAGNVRDVLHYYAGAPERLLGRQIPVPGGVDVTFHEPLGVVGVIVPWNFPMPIAAWGFAPALAAGNTVVLKPAELTPLTALRLAPPPSCSRCCPAEAAWWGGGSSPTRRCARCASPAPPRWGGGSWSAAPSRSSG